MDQGNDARRVVLFDFDGVIVRHQTLELFFRERLKGLGRWRLLLALPWLPFLPFMLRSNGGTNILGRVFLRAVTFGRTEKNFQRLVAAFGRAYARRPGVFVRDGVATMRRHIEAGDRVIIVTGNVAPLVEAILDEVNLRGPELIASQVRGGPFGVHFTRQNVDGMKVKAVERAGIARPFAIAYGDSVSDLAMLKAAEAAKLVNPSARTLKKMRKPLGEKLETLGWY